MRRLSTEAKTTGSDASEVHGLSVPKLGETVKRG